MKINKTYYSIIYINTNFLSSEKIAIGLIMFNNDNLIYKFSDFKIKISKMLFSKLSKMALKDIIRWTIFYLNTKPLFNIYETIREKSIHIGHILWYKQPTKIDFKCKEDVFDRLYEKWINNNLIEEQKEEEFKIAFNPS